MYTSIDYGFPERYKRQLVNANLGEKGIADSCRILEISKLLCELLCDYFTEGDF